MKNLLSALPCFTQIESITAITSGLSQHCFKVKADNKIYFAKTVTDSIEASIAVPASKSGLSPAVVYHDKEWLVCHFIDVNNLAKSQTTAEKKIEYAIKLMVQCHQLNSKPNDLTASDILNSLVNNAHYSIPQKTALLEFGELILAPIEHINGGVCCHGDLNFSNVLINQRQRTWLVDYECACTAPIEYDLAMLIAVNNLASDKTTIIIEQYESQSSTNVDPELLNHYLLFCYLVNALWYFNTYRINTNKENELALLKHTEKQWHALRLALNKGDSSLLSRLSKKLTNALATLNFSN